MLTADIGEVGDWASLTEEALRTPITPSPFKSWWKLVSSDITAALLPNTVPKLLET